MIPRLGDVEPSQLAAARQALSRTTVDEAIAELDAEWNELEVRRAQRARKGRTGLQAACEACHKFVSNPARECPHCGFWGARGYAA